MANLITDGWLYLSNGTDWMQLPCRQIKWGFVRVPTFTHEVGPWNFAYDLGTEYLVLKVTGMLLNTNAKTVIFETNMRKWLASGLIILKIRRTIAGAFETLDGTNTQYSVLTQKGWDDVSKIANEDGEVYEYGKLAFEESGDRAA